MRRFLPFVLVSLLAACSTAEVPAPQQEPVQEPPAVEAPAEPAEPAEPPKLNLRLEKNVTTDDQGTPHTFAVLHLTGAVETDIPLPETLGELMHVDPNAYGPYAQDNVDSVVAVLSAWWAGQGREFIVMTLRDPRIIKVEIRNGYEEGVCDPPEAFAEAEVPWGVEVSLQDFGDTVERSSVEFCHAQ